jgi:hypothetical protein
MRKADVIERHKDLLMKSVEVLVKEEGIVVNINRHFISLKVPYSPNPPHYILIPRNKIEKLKVKEDVTKND